MGKITTKEEVNLKYLENPKKFWTFIVRGRIERNLETRQAILDLDKPQFSYLYSLNIDRYPRKDLRNSACKSGYYAARYAYWVDRVPRKETWEAVVKSGHEVDLRYFRAWIQEYNRRLKILGKHCKVFP